MIVACSWLFGVGAVVGCVIGLALLEIFGLIETRPGRRFRRS